MLTPALHSTLEMDLFMVVAEGSPVLLAECLSNCCSVKLQFAPHGLP